jgi:Flp pilus assembly protein TadG
MKNHEICRNDSGATAIEFAITAPVFFMMLLGIIGIGMLLWTQIGLQHGAEMAARCATIDKTICNSESAIQNYAARQAFGLNPAPSTFVVSTSGCGNKVSATYSFRFVATYMSLPQFVITAQSCFPT